MDKRKKYKRRRFIKLRLKELIEALEKEMPEEDWYYLLESRFREILKKQC